jgi:hypothetical protein
MTALRDFEMQAIAAMAGEILTPSHLMLLAGIDRLETYEYTGCGYYATVAHPNLPQSSGMLSTPSVMGIVEERDGRVVQAGFVCYLEPGKLTLECHTWGGIEVPEDFRERNVAIRALL